MKLSDYGTWKRSTNNFKSKYPANDWKAAFLFQSPPNAMCLWVGWHANWRLIKAENRGAARWLQRAALIVQTQPKWCFLAQSLAPSHREAQLSAIIFIMRAAKWSQEKWSGGCELRSKPPRKKQAGATRDADDSTDVTCVRQCLRDPAVNNCCSHQQRLKHCNDTLPVSTS